MKRLKFLLLMLIFIGNAYADDVQPLGTEEGKENYRWGDPIGIDIKKPHQSDNTTVTIYGNILHFKMPSKNCTLYVYNEDGDLEYMTAIPDGTVTFALPSTISGIHSVLIVAKSGNVVGIINL